MKVSGVGLKSLALVVFAALALATFVMLFRATGEPVRFADPYTVSAVVPSGVQLAANGDVRQSGVNIGRITEVGHRGTRGVIRFEIRDEHAPLPEGTTVRVRTKTLVGENYLEVTPGKPGRGTLADGATLPLEQALEAVQVDEVLSTLDPATRASVKRNLDALGSGFAGRGDDVNRLAASVQPLSVDGARVTNVLAVQRRRVAGVIDRADDLLGAVGDRSDQLRTLTRQALTTARAVSARDTALARTFSDLPRTLVQVRTSTGRLAALSDSATPVVGHLDAAAPGLARAMVALRPAARDTRALTDRLPRLSRRLDPVLDALRSFSPATSATIPALAAVLREANPALAYLAPYSREAGAFFASVGSINDVRDAAGKSGRVHAEISETSLTTYTPEMRAALQALISTGGISSFRQIEKNAYLAPGRLENPEPFRGEYQRVPSAP